MEAELETDRLGLAAHRPKPKIFLSFFLLDFFKLGGSFREVQIHKAAIRWQGSSSLSLPSSPSS